MAGQKREALNVKDIKTSKINYKIHELKILHHNVQSLNNKLLEISISLSFDDINSDILCFTEHWSRESQLNSIYIDQFILVSSFNRPNRTGGGSSIFVRNFLCTKDITYIKGLGSENTFEISATELTDFNCILVCIYRSPDWNFDEFLYKLESVICKVQSRRTNIILCGDWNVNFLQSSSKLSELQNLLHMYNLINTVKSPTRITHNSRTLIDVMVIDLNWENQTIIYDLG
jgi:exonuclease III